MKDTRKPSKAMVEKLLKTQGMKLKLDNFIKLSTIRFMLPFLDPSEPLDQKIKKIESQIDDDLAIEAFTRVYAKYFSASELMDLIAFYKTPTGQKLSSIQNKIAVDIVDVAQEIIGKLVLKNLKDNKPSKGGPPSGIDFSEFEDPDKFEELH